MPGGIFLATLLSERVAAVNVDDVGNAVAIEVVHKLARVQVHDVDAYCRVAEVPQQTSIF